MFFHSSKMWFIYSTESKVLQYFGYVGHNFASLDAFLMFVKVTKHIEM